MPTVNVYPDYFFKLLGRKYTHQELDDICFDFGIELETGIDDKNVPILKFEVAANRYDLLSVEGIAQAIGMYQGLKKHPNITLAFENPVETIKVTEATQGIRKFVVGAILRDVDLGENGYLSFIDFQDKMHQNIGRHR